MKRVNVVTDELTYGVTEELNTLRTNLLFAGKDKQVILLTSCVSGEGKSDTTFNLGVSLTELGKKVMIVDGDLRKSVMMRRVDQGKVDKGLTHYLSGQSNLADVVYGTNVKNLHMVFAGPVPPNPTELLSSDLFKVTIESFREMYDYVLIDSAPFGMVVDAAILSEVCDASILLLESGNIKYRFAQEVKEKLEKCDCPLLGVVLNKVNRSKSSKYYGKQYKKYYGEKYQ